MANKRLVICVLFILAVKMQGIAQFGNEWINFSQRYFKFTITENGIYRISRNDLVSAGFPVSTVDPRKIQMFHQGIEMAIEVSGQADGIFNTNDYIQFYAEGADGTTDTPLYIEPDDQPHTYYNLFSDESAYFLTYRLDLQTGIRLDDFFENNSGGLPAESFCSQNALQVEFRKLCFW